MNKSCIIFYPEINIFDKTRSGGVAHLLANIEGYNKNNISVIAICSYYKNIYVKIEGNIFLNILPNSNINCEYDLLCSIKKFIQNSFTSPKIFLKNILNLLINKLIKLVIRLICLIQKIEIVHERSSKNFCMLDSIGGEIKKIYEINDFNYNYSGLNNSNICLVTDSKNYPKGAKYFVKPWPIKFSDQENLKIRTKKLVYLGSGLQWHNFELMFKIIIKLNSLDAGWTLDLYGPPALKNKLKNEKNERLNYKGFINDNDISSALSCYSFGLAFYSQEKGARRNSVGSPMKIIHYLYNGLNVVSNLINNRNLEKNCSSMIIDTNNLNVKQIAEKIIKTSNKKPDVKKVRNFIKNQYSTVKYFKEMMYRIED